MDNSKYRAVLKHKYVNTKEEEIVLKVEANSLYEAFIKVSFECLEKYPKHEIKYINPPTGFGEEAVKFKNEKQTLELFKLQELESYTRLETLKEFVLKPDFYIGQEFWVIDKNKPLRGEVIALEIHLGEERKSWFRTLFPKPNKLKIVKSFFKYHCTINNVNLQIVYHAGFGRYIVSDNHNGLPYNNVFLEYEYLVEFMKKDLENRLNTL